MPFILLLVRLSLTDMTGSSGHRSVSFPEAVSADCVLQYLVYEFWIDLYTVLICRSCGSCFLLDLPMWERLRLGFLVVDSIFVISGFLFGVINCINGFKFEFYVHVFKYQNAVQL